MRKFTIKINDNKTVELTQEIVGYVEESKATQLMIILNTELQAKDIDYHVINFRHGENDEKMVSQRIYQLNEGDAETDAYRSEDKIYITLPQYVTKYPLIFVQVEGHILKTDSETGREYLDTIIKSPVFFIRLDDSIVGDEGEFNSKVDGIFAEMQDLSSKLTAVMPAVEILEEGIEWDEITGTSKPNAEAGFGFKSVMIGDNSTNFTEGNYSVTIGRNLTALGENTVLVGKYGKTIEGIIFAVANGSEDSPKLVFEIAEIDATFYVKLYGVTPELTAPGFAIPTIKWIKDYLDAVVYPKYDGDITTLKEELPKGLEQVSNEILEARDALEQEIYANKPDVSGVLILTQSGWSLNDNGKYTQMVLSGVNPNNRNEVDVEVKSVEEWGKCFVLAVSESSNGVLFEANELPSEDLYFRITSTEVNYAV